MKCTHCNNKMVLRFSEHRGHFWGCSRYPKCGNPRAWCFYNSEDSLIYKYIISPETYNDISLYAELLKIENNELNNLLLKYEEHKSIFDSSSYKHF